jgi:hypothetical protein
MRASDARGACATVGARGRRHAGPAKATLHRLRFRFHHVMVMVMIVVMDDHHVRFPIMCGFPIFSMGIFVSSAEAGIARPRETTVASATTILFTGSLSG